MLHCAQGIPWSLKVRLLMEEYPLKIMLHFLKGILYFFKGSSMHRLFFRTETSPSFKVIVVYMKGFPFEQEIKQYHTQTYSFRRTAVCLEGYFLKGIHTFERNNVYTCMHVCLYVCMHACMYVCMYVCIIYIYILYIYVYIYMYMSHCILKNYTVNYVIWKWHCIFQMNIHIYIYT